MEAHRRGGEREVFGTIASDLGGSFMVFSLDIEFECIDGVYYADAPWLSEPIAGASWYEVYWAAMRARHE